MAHTEKDLEISTIVLLCLFVVVFAAILTVITRSYIKMHKKQRIVFCAVIIIISHSVCACTDNFTIIIMSAGAVIGLCLGLIIFVIISVVVYLKRRAQASANMGYVISEGAAPVVVTSATHTAPGGYPVTQIPATTYQPNAYGTPYPAQTTGNVSMQMPMPMPGAQPPMPGMQPHMVAYPPMPQPGAGVANMNPPTYDMAMANAGPSVMPGGYEKQMPYNPNYAQQ